MPIRAPRWVEVSDSQFAHEREGLAYLKEHLPNAAPYRLWTNFEFMDSQGRWHEVDALVLGQGRPRRPWSRTSRTRASAAVWASGCSGDHGSDVLHLHLEGQAPEHSSNRSPGSSGCNQKSGRN